jgi:hypothetical protein
MKAINTIVIAVAAAATVLGSAAAANAAPRDGSRTGERHYRMDPEQRAQFARKRLDREASMLEIKASQQATWDVYAAARLELMKGFMDAKPAAADVDAATLARQRAERAQTAAQGLAKLADATAKLQAVLSDEQRKTFDRLSRAFGHGRDCSGHDFGMGDYRGYRSDKGGNQPKSNAAPANPAR